MEWYLEIFKWFIFKICHFICEDFLDCTFRAINLLPNRVLGSVGQHVGEPIEQIARSRDAHFLASCAHDQQVKFWDISGLPAMMVSDYRQKKKKDGNLKSLSKKAFGVGDDFFSGLVEETEANKEEKEDESKEESDSDSDWGLAADEHRPSVWDWIVRVTREIQQNLQKIRGAKSIKRD